MSSFTPSRDLPAFQQRARNHIANLESAGHRFGISELTWTECLVLPLGTGAGNGPLLLDYQRFFLGPHLTTVRLTPTVYQRAALIRGTHGFSLADSLHLAVAVEHRFERFLTSDQALVGFTDITIELLP